MKNDEGRCHSRTLLPTTNTTTCKVKMMLSIKMKKENEDGPHEQDRQNSLRVVGCDYRFKS